MKDEVFIRGKVPMTKAEVRAVSIDLLSLDEKSKNYWMLVLELEALAFKWRAIFPKSMLLRLSETQMQWI